MNNMEKLYDKINACWMGKNIGGTLGAPFEGCMDKMHLTEFPDLKGKGPLPNDDLDLQLVNLHALEQRGYKITVKDLSEEWLEHVRFPFDEYGYALTNMRRGMLPPLSGYYNNSFTGCMGSPIRSELWASVAPGRPDVAAYYAYNDATVDHAGGEGVYGEVFFSALESMAYFETDIDLLIDKAIKYIPENCETALALTDTLNWYRAGVTYDEIRDLILEKYGNPNFTNAPQNIAFTMVGLLYGEDFKDGLLKTVNLGYDTDCTTATIGAIYGILYGMEYIPDEWKSCVGENIKVSSEIQELDYPKTIKELTDRTIATKKMLDMYADSEFSYKLFENLNSQEFFLPSGNGRSPALKISVISNELPFINNDEKPVTVKLENNTFGDWNFKVIICNNKNQEVYKSEIIDLSVGNIKELDVKLPITSNEFSVSEYTIKVEKYFDKRIWKNYTNNFVLPVASEWAIDGKKVYGKDGCVDVLGKGEHSGKTMLSVPTDRTVKFMFATSEPLKVKLDGKVIIETKNPTAYIPAYHRGEEELCAIKQLSAGTHTLEFTVNNISENSTLSILPTAQDAKDYYMSDYLLDCLFIREK